MKKYRKELTKRIVAFMLTVILAANMIDLSVFAATQNGTVITGGLCEHHTEHTAECGYEEAVEGSSCTYTCSECSQTDAEKEIEAGQPEEADCTCGTDDDAIHATDCPKYTVPENPMCTCVEKCTGDNVNVWCDVCGVQGAEACESKGDEEAVTFEEVANITYLSCDENGQNWEVATCESATVVSSENTTWTSGWYVLNSDVSFSVSDEITVSGTVNLILADGYILTVRNGINVSEGNSLTIYAQSTGDNMGNLYVTGGNVVAGIGGRKGKNGGAITINGGTVTATGNGGGAGIGGGVGIGGGGDGGTGGTITINGGTVTATGGIGGGAGGTGGKGGNGVAGGDGGNGVAGGDGGTITINGGTVTATGNGEGAGIGGGARGTGGKGGTGGAGGDDGVGGVGGAGGTIEITGGIVSATAGTNAEHIGEGAEATSEGTVSYADCLVFEGGSDGKVYGDFILDTNFTLENSKSITVPNTATLTVAENVTLTNEGTITYEAPVSGTGYTIDYKMKKL